MKPDVGGAGEDRALRGSGHVAESYPGVASEAVTFLGDRISESLSARPPLSRSASMATTSTSSTAPQARVATVVSKVNGAADVQVKSPPGTPVLKIRLDTGRMGIKASRRPMPMTPSNRVPGPRRCADHRGRPRYRRGGHAVA